LVHCCQVDNNTVNDEEISSLEEDGGDVGSEDEEEAVAPTIHSKIIKIKEERCHFQETSPRPTSK